MKKRSLFLILTGGLLAACAHTPPAPIQPVTYQWVSLSDQGYTEHLLTVKKESPDFYTEKGFEDLDIQKKKITDGSFVPTKKDHLQKIIFIGDTGCRLKEGRNGNVYQNCSDPKDWTYPEVAKKIADEKADLVVHVGDYHYREQCSEGQPCRKMTNTAGPGWKSWEADFFAPSRPAFAASPWIFVRGNHEDCHRAFAGYKLLTDQAWDQNCVDYEKPQWIQLGDLLIVQFDSSGVEDREPSEDQEKFVQAQLQDIERLAKKTSVKHLWFISHKPVTALVEDHENLLHLTNSTLRRAFAKTSLTSKFEVMIAGHIHDSQYLKAPHFPPQVVIGNGGTALDEFSAFQHPEKIRGAKVDGVKIAEFLSDPAPHQSFGYAVLSRSLEKPDNWKIEFKDLEGRTRFEKELKHGRN